MPEGHVTHRLANAVTSDLAGQVVISTSPQGRFTDGAAHVGGRVLTAAESHGKHVLVGFEDIDERVHVHLGMAGRWQLGSGTAPSPVGVIRWRMQGDRTYADLRGPAACELLRPDEVATLLGRLGPDPLRPDADPERGWTRVHASSRSIASLLMDQRVAAGVGNIFRAEVLYRQQLDPMMPGRLLRHAEWESIWDDLVELMHAALAIGRIDTVRPEHLPEAMGRAPRVDRHGGEVYVYRRAGQRCHVCGSVVRTAEVETRNLFWCPGCQRRTRRRAPAKSQVSARR